MKISYGNVFFNHAATGNKNLLSRKFMEIEFVPTMDWCRFQSENGILISNKEQLFDYR